MEGYDRFRTILQVRRQGAPRTHDYHWQDPATGLALLESAAAIDIQSHLADPALAQLEAQIQRSFQQLGDHPFHAHHNGDAHLARTCYAIIRGLRPTLAVETGVCYGVTSACLLQAMQQNGIGQLAKHELSQYRHNTGHIRPVGLRRLLHGRSMHKGDDVRIRRLHGEGGGRGRWRSRCAPGERRRRDRGVEGLPPSN